MSTLKGFKFGFKSGLKAEVLFINTKEFLVKWGTKSPINIQAPGMPGGMPIRAFGSFNVKISDHMVLIDKIAGIKSQFTVDDVKQRALAVVDQLLMKWIVREGKDMFNLQANSFEIAKGIKTDVPRRNVQENSVETIAILAKLWYNIYIYCSDSYFSERFDNMNNNMEIQKEAIIEIVGTQYNGRAVNHQKLINQQNDQRK